MLPDYGCLIFSPANLWKRDINTFQMDDNLISTIFHFQKSREGHSSISDLMFGLSQRDSGITRYPVRNRQRVVTYSVTVALKRYNPDFINKLRKHLTDLYPLHRSLNRGNKEDDNITFMYFPSRLLYLEVIPFVLTLLLLFLYVYFSCWKIELVHSKLGIALCAVMTVLGAISMSLGLSSLSLNLNSQVYLGNFLKYRILLYMSFKR